MIQEWKKLTDALFGFFLRKEGQQKRSKLDRTRKLEKEDEEIYKTCLQECYSWQKPPADVIENILKRLNIGDRIRLSIVSKHWNSIVTRTDIRGAPHELPWLLLPHPRRWEILSFLTSLSDGKLVKLKLPKSVRGGWVYGSTDKGSLIIVKEQGLESAIFLVNPISKALHKLPPFKTISCFREFIKTRQWKHSGANGFCPRIAVDSVDSNNWTMAAVVLSDSKKLGFCRPGDKTWSVYQVIDDNEDVCLVIDILFSCGTLYALLQSHQRDGEIHATRTLKFVRGNGLEVKLKLVFDKHEFLDDHRDYNSTYCGSALSESTTNEVLVIHQMKDSFWGRRENHGNEVNHEDDNTGGNALNNQGPNNDEQVEDEEASLNSFLRTRSFKAYKIDPYNNKFIALQCLEDQLLFLGEGGSFSLPANDFQEVRNNCIYFATHYTAEFDSSPKTLISPEIGIFYFERERIERSSLDQTIMSPLYQPTWFIPYF